MSPLALIALIVGIPSLIGLVYIFLKGSTGLRRYILTRIALTLPMIFTLATLVFSSCVSCPVTRSHQPWGQKVPLK
jgi:hypothetical protein